jgi:hypothetical protein
MSLLLSPIGCDDGLSGAYVDQRLSAYKAEDCECNGEYLFHVPSLTKSVGIVAEVYT